MSRPTSLCPVLLAPIGLVLVFVLGGLAPLQAQGPASNPPLAPPPPVKASDCTHTTHVHISWLSVSGAMGYLVKRSATLTGHPVTVCPLTAGTSCDDLTVPVNQPHYYWVEPVFPTGPGRLRGPGVGIRKGPGPLAPTGLDASIGTHTDFVRLTWDDHADTPIYHLRRGTSSAGPFMQLVSGLTTNNYDDTSTAPGVIYYYHVQGEDYCDQKSPWSAQDKGYRGIGPLPAPTNLEASDCTYEDKVRLEWDFVQFALNFRVLRAESLGGIKTRVTDVWDSHYDDDPPELNRTYYYWVRTCTDTACTVLSDLSQPDSGKKCCDPPPVPSNVQASDGAHEDKIVVTWDASTGATTYKVYRAPTPTGEGHLQDTVNTTSWEDTAADASTYYHYTVEACSVCGCSVPSAVDGGYRGAAPPPTMSHASYVPLVLR